MDVMKNMRAFLMCLVMVACLVSGCATTSQDSYSATSDMKGIEKKQTSPTEDMSTIQKTGYYLGWYSLASLYVWAGGSAPLLPP
jgi:outer membrane lipoprotein-sorting protein